MPPVYQDITGVILAGGKSTRFGKNKAFASFKGIPFLERIQTVLSNIFNEVYLVTNTPKSYENFPFSILKDEIPNQGPLGGILTALKHVRTNQCFVVACDMPLIDANIIQEVVDRGRGWDAAIPVARGTPQYLMALYSKSLLPAIEESVRRGELEMKEFCRVYPRVKWVPVKGIASFNINTPEDLLHLEKCHAL